MNTEQTASQLELAAQILRTGHPFEVCRHRHQEWFTPNPMPVTERMPPEYEIHLTLATPPDGRSLHNPDNLTAEQVGAGWRLLLEAELDGRMARGQNGCECFYFDLPHWRASGDGSVMRNTYRVPLSTPWSSTPPFQLPPSPPDKMVELVPEDVPPGSVFLSPSDKAEFQWTRKTPHGINIVGDSRLWLSWEELKNSSLLVNRSLPLTGKWNPDAWERCHKPANP